MEHAVGCLVVYQQAGAVQGAAHKPACGSIHVLKDGHVARVDAVVPGLRRRAPVRGGLHLCHECLAVHAPHVLAGGDRGGGRIDGVAQRIKQAHHHFLPRRAKRMLGPEIVTAVAVVEEERRHRE